MTIDLLDSRKIKVTIFNTARPRYHMVYNVRSQHLNQLDQNNNVAWTHVTCLKSAGFIID